jgi:hypothetical protein
MKHVPNFIKLRSTVLALEHADAHCILSCVIFFHDVQTMPLRGYITRTNATPRICRITILKGAWDVTTVGTRSIESKFLSLFFKTYCPKSFDRAEYLLRSVTVHPNVWEQSTPVLCRDLFSIVAVCGWQHCWPPLYEICFLNSQFYEIYIYII